VLAPAGDLAALKAALAAGADAVYFGLREGFNARARTGNFALADLADRARAPPGRRQSRSRQRSCLADLSSSGPSRAAACGVTRASSDPAVGAGAGALSRSGASTQMTISS
jgi:putative protease